MNPPENGFDSGPARPFLVHSLAQQLPPSARYQHPACNPPFLPGTGEEPAEGLRGLGGLPVEQRLTGSGPLPVPCPHTGVRGSRRSGGEFTVSGEVRVASLPRTRGDPRATRPPQALSWFHKYGPRAWPGSDLPRATQSSTQNLLVFRGPSGGRRCLPAPCPNGTGESAVKKDSCAAGFVSEVSSGSRMGLGRWQRDGKGAFVPRT